MEIDERKEDVVEVFTEYLVNNGLKKSQERGKRSREPGWPGRIFPGRGQSRSL